MPSVKSKWVETPFKWERGKNFIKRRGIRDFVVMPRGCAYFPARGVDPLLSVPCNIWRLEKKTIDIKESFKQLERQANQHEILISDLKKMITTLNKRSSKGNTKVQGLDSLTDKLVQRNKSRLDKFDKDLKSIKSIIASSPSKNSTDTASNTDTDAITGLKTKVTAIENAVKLDPIRPGAKKDAGISDLINSNYEDIQSNSLEFDKIFARLAAAEENIASPYSSADKLDLLGMITSLTNRVVNLEETVHMLT